jgi:hypothetical protein
MRPQASDTGSAITPMALAAPQAAESPRVQSVGRLRMSIQRVTAADPDLTRGATRVIASPTRSGDLAACVVQPQRSDVRIWRVDADGRSRPDLALPPFDPDRPLDTIAPNAPQAWAVAGFSWLGSGGFALAYVSTGTDADTSGPGVRRVVVRGHAADGTPRWLLDNLLQARDSRGDADIVATRDLHGPPPGTAVHMAYGRGHLCLHFGHLARWPDGSMVHGGFARALRLPPPGTDRSSGAAVLAGTRAWFGSRSLDQRCTFDPYRDSFVIAALSDGFPRAVLVSRLGRGAWRDQVLQHLPGEPGATDVAAELGGVVPLRESVAVSFTSAVAAQPESRDVFVAFVMPDLHTTPLVVKVTSHSPGTYAVAPKLAAMGRHLLVAWTRMSPLTGNAEPMVAVVTAQAQLLIPPQVVQGLVLDPVSDLFTDVHGAVNWFALQPDGLHWLRMRFARGPWRTATQETAGDARRNSADDASADDARRGRRP